MLDGAHFSDDVVVGRGVSKSDESSGNVTVSFFKSMVQDSAMNDDEQMPSSGGDVTDEERVPFSVGFYEGG